MRKARAEARERGRHYLEDLSALLPDQLQKARRGEQSPYQTDVRKQVSCLE